MVNLEGGGQAWQVGQKRCPGTPCMYIYVGTHRVGGLVGLVSRGWAPVLQACGV